MCVEAEYPTVSEDAAMKSVACNEDIETGKDVCQHCGKELTYSVKHNANTFTCPHCGKRTPLCGKCGITDELTCEKCVSCDVANFYNYLSKKITLEKFLSCLNPPLTDVTMSDLEDFTPSYENFVNDVGEDSVCWDYKYWTIYGRVLNSMLNVDSDESVVRDFVLEIIKENRS